MYFPLLSRLNGLQQLSFPCTPLHPRSFHPFSFLLSLSSSLPFLHQPLFSTFVYIHSSCMRFLTALPSHPFSSLSLFPPPFPEVFTKLFNFPVDSSRVFRCLVPSKALQRAGGNRKSRVLLKGGNALFKCSPREHTEDKTAPRRRIRRVNRHLLFLPFSFPSLVSSTAVTGGAAIFSLQLLGEERSCSTFFLFFVSAAAQREKKRSSIRFIDESDPE